MPRPGFGNLPTEILHLIAQEIEEPSHRLCLALCSHTFSDLFLPLLYQDIDLSNCDTKAVICLVQTLLRNPRLASCTQTLEINDWSTDLNSDANHYDVPEILPSPNSELVFDSILIHGAVQKFFTSSDDDAISKFMAHLAAGNEDAWVGVLLFALPNLTELSMVVPYGTFFPLRLVERAAARLPPFDSQPALTHLSHLFVKWWDTENSLDSSAVEPFYFFPSMRRVVGEQISDYPSEEEEDDEGVYDDERLDSFDRGRTAYLENKPTTSTVTEIEMARSSTTTGMIAQIKICQNLKSFTFEHADSFEYFSSFLPKDFARSLAHVKHSLEHLWLSYDDYHFNGQCYEGDDEVFGSLAEYTVLKSLRMSVENLIGSDALLNPEDIVLSPPGRQRLAHLLPASIESITVDNVSKRNCPGALMLLKDLVEPSSFARYTPQLKKLRLEGHFAIVNQPNQPLIMTTLDGPEPVISPEILVSAGELQDLCSHVGVVFNLLDSHMVLRFRQLRARHEEWQKSQAGTT
ncbi:hypothetical protein ACJ72_07340 [Emergomyces africanus]|uniref:Leucine-rich repeat domain-containing protein n=1 Tax=Emergomyces africanus TaxID=1955775 RepID=A0A1B7NNG7_9EURO|nr:hypothetical protein ACJ72_07340 [Emergomyces africanus]